MEKDQIILFKDRGLISINGDDAKDFLQNIITNDINKVNQENSIYSGIFTPQGKFLFEFLFQEQFDDKVVRLFFHWCKF